MAGSRPRTQPRISPREIEGGSVAEETDASIAAATHLTPMDAGAIAALRVLARSVDALADRPALDADGRALPLDNVSLPTYLRYCEALGLTPASRTKLAEEKGPSGGGKLAQLRADLPAVLRGAGADAGQPDQAG